MGRSSCWKGKTLSVLKLLNAAAVQVKMNLTVQSVAGRLLGLLRFHWRSTGMGTFTFVYMAHKAPTRYRTTGIFCIHRGC